MDENEVTINGIVDTYTEEAPLEFSASWGAVAKALLAAQAELLLPHARQVGKIAGRNKAGQAYEYQYKYADLADVIEATRPALVKAGILTMWGYIYRGGKEVTVECRLVHAESGEWVRSRLTLISEDGRAQTIGMAMTYGRRYLYNALVGVVAHEDDDDGASASHRSARGRDAGNRGGVAAPADPSVTADDKVSETQVAQLTAWVIECDADMAKVCRYFGVTALAELPERKFGLAKKLLADFAAQKRTRAVVGANASSAPAEVDE